MYWRLLFWIVPLLHTSRRWLQDALCGKGVGWHVRDTEGLNLQMGHVCRARNPTLVGRRGFGFQVSLEQFSPCLSCVTVPKCMSRAAGAKKNPPQLRINVVVIGAVMSCRADPKSQNCIYLSGPVLAQTPAILISCCTKNRWPTKRAWTSGPTRVGFWHSETGVSWSQPSSLSGRRTGDKQRGDHCCLVIRRSPTVSDPRLKKSVM